MINAIWFDALTAFPSKKLILAGVQSLVQPQLWPLFKGQQQMMPGASRSLQEAYTGNITCISGILVERIGT
jgi:hypothetical protein